MDLGPLPDATDSTAPSCPSKSSPLRSLCQLPRSLVPVDRFLRYLVFLIVLLFFCHSFSFFSKFLCFAFVCSIRLLVCSHCSAISFIRTNFPPLHPSSFLSNKSTFGSCSRLLPPCMTGQLNCSGAEWQQVPIPQSGVLISCPNASGTQTECAFILLTHVCYLEEKLSKMLSLEPERPPERSRGGEEEGGGRGVEGRRVEAGG